MDQGRGKAGSGLEHWENYYRGGALASCPTSAAGDYDRELRDVWVRLFTDLPDGARAFDVGTGNGAGRLAGIRFHPGVATERLPFNSGYFDVATGQYALEYADMARALAEIHRVLKPGGRALFVLHHAESAIARNARESLSHAQLVLKDTRIHMRLRRHLEAERKSPASARRTWVDLRQAASRLQQALAEAGASRILEVSLDAVHKLLEARSPAAPAALAREIDKVETDLRAGVRRLQDLLDRARSPQEMDAIAQQALVAGFTEATFAPQFHAVENLVGWRLALARS
jgi:SAM-dependent methyltransferase